ncbi:MAG: transketolase [Chloroflexota bacterium]
MAEIEQLCVNAIRVLAMDAVQQANSGHPGMPMGMADAAFVLWTRHLKHNPKNPAWPDRDRFILSAGHGSMLLYALLHLSGVLTLEDIKAFRQWGSRTPGHPEYGHTPGVEVTTGPLGQGFAAGVGMALAERWLAEHFNRPGHIIVDHFTYAIVSDGDLMEGVSYEAASLAGHLGLGRLIYLYDDNDISIDGPTDLAFSEDVRRRFEACGWQVLEVDGHDRAAVDQALAEARAEVDRPTLIICHTHIAYGSPGKQDSAAAHGAPLGVEEVRRTKQALGWPEEPPFYVPPEVYDYFAELGRRWAALEAEWWQTFGRWRSEYPDLAAQWDLAMSGRLPEGWEEWLPKATGKSMPTREASGRVLNALASHIPWLVGGSADLSESTRTYLEGFEPIRRGGLGGRNIHYGVREHAMGGILNGLALHGGIIPYGGTFLVFSDYMRPAIRLAALMRLPVVYVFSHDSIFLGEDGPTHQPVEHLASLRAIPNLTVVRPADEAEVVEAWRVILGRRDGPVALILTRQKVPACTGEAAAGLRHGAYILREASRLPPDVILIASGSEVALALGAAEVLEARGVAARVVSMPSWELFEAQPEDYRRRVLPPEVRARVVVEAAGLQGWERYVGPVGRGLGLRGFGASAPHQVLAEKFGFTVERLVELAEEALAESRALQPAGA